MESAFLQGWSLHFTKMAPSSLLKADSILIEMAISAFSFSPKEPVSCPWDLPFSFSLINFH